MTTDEPVRVDLPVLRAAAGGLTDEAYALARGLAGRPGLVPSAPGWRAGAALAGLESAVHGRPGWPTPGSAAGRPAAATPGRC
ncbi:hypothetical protein [Micromonospora wenchangensis]|uniref:hypothetical protein n=1 Tax=Micromonospora wenchangensis TaxID=1185415 RepID=UPI003421E1D9